MIVPAHEYQREINLFVSRGLGVPPFEMCQCLGWATEAEGLVAGVVFHNFDPDRGAIEMSAYSQNCGWLDRNRLRAVFSYPFDQLKCRIAVARIAESNTTARRIWRALGSSETLVPDLYAAGEAEAICILRADAWQKSNFVR